MSVVTLHKYLADTARLKPDLVAVQEGTGASVTYRELDALSDRLRNRLVAAGVRPGDRVGMLLRKSIDSVAVLFGILKCGAAYVPVDPAAPPTRNGLILSDCSVTVAIVEDAFADALRKELNGRGSDPQILSVGEVGGGAGLEEMLDRLDVGGASANVTGSATSPDDLAIVLYTSGSTGRPKGVQITHRNATCFVDWCSSVFKPTQEDRFSSHAPLHFDLSVLDIYCAAKHGARLVLIGEEVGKRPGELAALVASSRISVWYSAPSILSLMAEFGRLEGLDLSALRLVLFAGEVFPVARLRLLTRLLPGRRYFNLYGPTETNVCTWFEVPLPIPDEQSEPMPIGRVCPHFDAVILDPAGKPVARGTEGELCVSGQGVTRGYWNLPGQSQSAFIDIAGKAYYRTGDIVVELGDGNLRYVGRRDRMIKKRGFRVELGEIEACLHRHAGIREAAVLAIPDESLGMKVIAHIATTDAQPLSIIELKTFCSSHLPVYMIPDTFAFHSALPRTSTDKVDYQRLKEPSGPERPTIHHSSRVP
jgi:amino acid adenylation domain-containing protein